MARSAVAIGNYQGFHPDSPIDLGCGVAFEAVPAWLRSEDVVSKLDSMTKHGLLQDCHWALTWDGPEEVLGTGADELFAMAVLALWLAVPNGMYLSVTVTVDEDVPTALSRRTSWGNRFYPHDSYQSVPVAAEHFAKARCLLPVLMKLSTKGTLDNASWCLSKALWERDFIPRYAFLCIALESLYGPDDGREITHRLAQRTALFLKEEPVERQKVFGNLKRIYKWRSKLVHGLRLAKLKSEESAVITLDAEMIVRETLLKVLLDPQLLIEFESKRRDRFLDNLALGGSQS